MSEHSWLRHNEGEEPSDEEYFDFPVSEHYIDEDGQLQPFDEQDEQDEDDLEVTDEDIVDAEYDEDHYEEEE